MNQEKKLLIIDDDPDFAEGIKIILESAKYKVDVAYNPKDGYQVLQSRPYDMLLLDIMMGRGAERTQIKRYARSHYYWNT